MQSQHQPGELDLAAVYDSVDANVADSQPPMAGPGHVPGDAVQSSTGSMATEGSLLSTEAEPPTPSLPFPPPQPPPPQTPYGTAPAAPPQEQSFFAAALLQPQAAGEPAIGPDTGAAGSGPAPSVFAGPSSSLPTSARAARLGPSARAFSRTFSGGRVGGATEQAERLQRLRKSTTNAYLRRYGLPSAAGPSVQSSTYTPSPPPPSAGASSSSLPARRHFSSPRRRLSGEGNSHLGPFGSSSAGPAAWAPGSSASAHPPTPQSAAWRPFSADGNAMGPYGTLFPSGAPVGQARGSLGLGREWSLNGAFFASDDSTRAARLDALRRRFDAIRADWDTVPEASAGSWSSDRDALEGICIELFELCHSAGVGRPGGGGGSAGGTDHLSPAYPSVASLGPRMSVTFL